MTEYIILNTYYHPFRQFIMEGLFVGITITFCVLLVKKIIKAWNHHTLKKITARDPDLKNSDPISQLLNYSVRDLSGIRQMLKIIVLRFLTYLYKFWRALIIFITKEALYIPMLISVILTVASVINWIHFMVVKKLHEIDPNLTLGSLPIQEEIEVYNDFEKIKASYDTVRNLQSYNAIFLIIGIFPFLRFSLRLSSVIINVRLSKNRFFAFFTIFFLLVISYGVSGYFFYGAELQEFKNYGYSTMQMLFMLFGSIPFEKMQTTAPKSTPVFVFSYLILAYMGFIRLTVLILHEPYAEFLENYMRVN